MLLGGILIGTTIFSLAEVPVRAHDTGTLYTQCFLEVFGFPKFWIKSAKMHEFMLFLLLVHVQRDFFT